MPGELFRRRVRGLGDQFLLAAEERGLELVVEFGGEVGEHVGVLGGDITVGERLAERLGLGERRRAALATCGFFRRQVSVACQHIGRGCVAALFVEFAETGVDGGFEAGEQTVQAAHRTEHGDQFGDAERGDVAALDGGEVGVRVVPHHHTITNVRSTSQLETQENSEGRCLLTFKQR